MLKNMRISFRLALILGLLQLLLLGVVGIAFWQMGVMRAATHDIAEVWLPSVEHVNQLNTSTSHLRMGEFQHVLNTDAKAMAGIEQVMATTLAAFEDDRKAYVALISNDEERKLYERFAAKWKQYMQVHDQVLALSRNNDNEKAQALLEGDAAKVFDEAGAMLQRLVELNGKGADASSVASEQAFFSARLVLLVAVAAALVVAVALGAWMIRSITAPLREAAGAADRVASGDLTGAIDVSSQDETGRVLHALQRMQASLVQVVSRVRLNSESVATASAQIAQGNQDLSQRTEEQASALEETAATMDELGSTVRNNAESAKQANQLAQGASTVATQGGEVVGQVVTTMRGISDSSRRIGDIIGVIDGIAFQTNILALNAAVEAARAGEQGRGFAVVAGEVRALAQRSAEAAKEIKALIGRSVEQVEQGTALVDQAGQTMGEIVGAIQRVRDIVAEITTASVEQSSGVQQVGEAVNQMDHATQRNAALVEESAAAAQSLQEQAQQLVQAVAVFKLADEGRYAAVAPVPTRAATAKASAPARTAERRQPAALAKAATRASAKAAPSIATSRPAADDARRDERVATAGRDDWETF